MRHPLVRKISFTGNSETGERIRTLAASYPKELTLELGGSDPMIVMEDAHIDMAVEGAVRGRFYNAGQVCTAVKRLYVHEKIAGTFLRKLKARIDAMNVGNGLGPKTEMGPLNSAVQRERIARLVEETHEDGGGTVMSGGCPLTGKAYEAGFYYRPTLVSDVPGRSRLLTEEVFGPILPVMTVPDLDAAIREANATRFGLGASVWTTNIHTVRKVFDNVHARYNLGQPPPHGSSRRSRSEA